MNTYVMCLEFNPKTGKLFHGEIVPKKSPKLDSRVASEMKKNKPKNLNPYMPFKFFDYGGGECLRYEYFIVKMASYERKQINKALEYGMAYDDILHLIFSIEIDRMVFPDIDGDTEKSEILTDEFYDYLGGA